MQISIIKKSDVQEARRFDAEFFKPEYLEIENKIINHNWSYLKDISEDILTGKTPQYEKNAKTLVVRSGDLRKNLIDIDELLKTNETDLFYLNRNDVLISSIGKGSIGKIAINYEKEKIATVSEVTVIRNAKITSTFLNMFLLSHFGQAQIEKFITGATGQLHLLPSNIKKIKIPIFPQSFQLQIEKIVKSAYEKQTQSKQLYKEAEGLLLKEVDLLSYAPEHILSFETTKKETDEARRFDAEYFQPKYEEIIKKIQNYKNGFDVAKNILNFNKKNFFPKENEFYNYIPLSRVSNSGEIEIPEKELGGDLPTRARRKVKKGEIILSSINGSLETSAIIGEEHENFIVSNGFYVFNSEKINSETLLVLFKSKIMIVLLQKISKGAILGGYDLTAFEKFKIPLIKPQIQKQIAKKIQESHKLRKESKKLLEEAKRKVEEEISREN